MSVFGSKINISLPAEQGQPCFFPKCAFVRGEEKIFIVISGLIEKIGYFCNIVALSNTKNQKMKKILFAALMGSAFIFTACNNDDDDGNGTTLPGDNDAPTITFAEGRDSFRPDMGEARSATTTHMHIRFRVTDESPLEEVTASVTGNYLGTVPENFSLLTITDVYNSENPDSPFFFPEGATELNVDSDETDIYWFGNQARPEVTGAVVAGPYDFTVRARDAFGNETSEEENVNHRFYINRTYAPSIEVTNLHDGELDGEENEPLEVEGTISAGEGNFAGELSFIWVRLVNEDNHDDFAPAEAALAEVIWGSSTRIQASGQALPAGDIDLAAALSGENAVILPDGHGHYDLIVWAEDVHGNVTRATVEVHVH